MYIKRYPIFFRISICILLPLFLALCAAYLHLKNSLPIVNGKLIMLDVKERVDIYRDEDGVVRIEARQDEDAFFAIGFVHAQDRIWQMEYKRRLAKGLLSEVVGLSALQSDKFMRTIGLARSAKEAYSQLDEETRQNLVSYSQGVNAWIESNPVLPIEFHLLGIAPSMWDPVDSVLLTKLMALDLSQNFNDELLAGMLIKEIGAKSAGELLNGDPDDVRAITGLDAGMEYTINYELSSLSEELGLNKRSIGSNAWVVSGNHTKNGKPLLASDPHLRAEIPSAWYLLEVDSKNLKVVGATFPGMPYIVFGRNSRISWASTNLTADVQDLYVERINLKDENQYEVDGKWREMDITEEIIKIKPNLPKLVAEPIPDIKWTIRRTIHGPIITDVVGESGSPMSLRWTALDRDDITLAAFRKINYSLDWQSFMSAIADVNSPALNYIYADVDGNIGYSAAGKVPIRNVGDGRVPVPGWKSQYNWTGYVPINDLPKKYNPISGYIVNANNKVHDSDYKYHISNSWSPPYRVQRISDLIEEMFNKGKKIQASDFVTIQGDMKSLQYDQIKNIFFQLKPRTAEEKSALDIIKSWNGIVSPDSEAAALYEAWLRNYNIKILKDNLRGELIFVERSNELQAFLDKVNPIFLNWLINEADADDKNKWCDYDYTPTKETCEIIALDALGAAITELKKHSSGRWSWGKIHESYYGHTIFNNIQVLDRIFDRKVAAGGDAYTVRVSESTYSQDKGYRQTVGPTYRQIIDLSDWTLGGMISDTGQSGNLLSNHYDDFINRHEHLDLIPFKPETTDRTKLSLLKLVPEE